MTRTPDRWRAAGLTAAFLLPGVPAIVAGYGLAAALLWPGGAEPGPVAAAALQTGVTLLVIGLLTWLVGFHLAGLDARGLRWRPGGPGSAGRGLIVGAAPAAAVVAVAVLGAGAGWEAAGWSLRTWGRGVLALGVLLAPAAAAEELMFRGVALVLLARAFGRGPAVVTTGVLFGLLHALNPGVTLLAIGNVALAGVFLGTAFYLPGGLWTATGAHLGWNLTLAALAAPVSGLPLPVPGLHYRPGGPNWLTGGSFGPEGGVLATAILTLGTVVVARNVERERTG